MKEKGQESLLADWRSSSDRGILFANLGGAALGDPGTQQALHGELHDLPVCEESSQEGVDLLLCGGPTHVHHDDRRGGLGCHTPGSPACVWSDGGLAWEIRACLGERELCGLSLCGSGGFSKVIEIWPKFTQLNLTSEPMGIAVPNFSCKTLPMHSSKH